MRTTLNLDDQLLAEAQPLTGIRERTALVHKGLRLLIQREAARRLARLGGSAPDLDAWLASAASRLFLTYDPAR